MASRLQRNGAVRFTASTFCQGTTVSFATAVNNEGNAPVYQWKKNGNPVGTGLSTYTDNTLQNGDVITCTLTSNASCVSPLTVTSNPITVIVTGTVIPTITITPSANNVCINTPVTFSATSTDGGTAPSYQWTVNGANVGSNNATFTSSTLGNNDIVKCILTSNLTCANPSTVSSNTVTMNLSYPVTPTISIGATTGGICLGDVASFTATYTNGGSSPSFQ